MKHMRQLTKQRPAPAQLALVTVFTALSQILEVVGTMLITKDELMQDPYDY